MARQNPVKINFNASRRSRKYNKMMPTLDESIADLGGLLDPFAGGDYDPLHKPNNNQSLDESHTETTVDMGESYSTWGFDSSESNNYSQREDEEAEDDDNYISEEPSLPPPHEALFPKIETDGARFLVNNEDPNHNTVWSHVHGCATPHLEFKPMTTPGTPRAKRHSMKLSLREFLRAERRHTSIIPRPPFD
jgi:hypothetical protein